MGRIKHAWELFKKGELFEILKSRRFDKKMKNFKGSDEEFIKIYGKALLGYDLNLKEPKTLCEKLNWLKLHYRKDELTNLVDKYAVKKIIADKIGAEHVIECYGVWDHFDDIDFDKLPKQFVLKCTHDSGSIVVVTDKDNFDKVTAKEKLEAKLKIDYYQSYREWPYKNVPRRIIAEKYIDSLGKPDSIEYKVTCYNGKAEFVMIYTGTGHSKCGDAFDVNFNHQPWYNIYKNSPTPLEKPKQWDELIKLGEKIAEGLPCVRVDFYVVDGRIYFGEITLFTTGGFMEITPKEWDLKLGKNLKLPDLKEKEINK